MPRPLESESIERLQQIFESARSDLLTLARLEAELEQRPASSSRLLRLKVIAARVALKNPLASKRAERRNSAAATPLANELPRQSDAPTSRPLEAFLSGFGLRTADGRPLHAYKLSAESHEHLERLLVGAAKSGRLEKFNREDAALFVLWAADWFRR